jgi:hypothetical protein
MLLFLHRRSPFSIDRTSGRNLAVGREPYRPVETTSLPAVHAAANRVHQLSCSELLMPCQSAASRMVCRKSACAYFIEGGEGACALYKTLQKESVQQVRIICKRGGPTDLDCHLTDELHHGSSRSANCSFCCIQHARLRSTTVKRLCDIPLQLPVCSTCFARTFEVVDTEMTPCD